MPFIHTCQKCGETFTNKIRNTKYCCAECYFNTKKRKEYINCEVCNKVIAKRDKGTKFCSQKCYRINNTQIRKCKLCENEFKVNICVIKRGKNAGKFCSQKCVNAYRINDKNPNWRGGIIYNLKKKNKELKKLRPIIRNKYNYTCQKCGDNKTGIILDVHHIIPYRLTQDNSLINLTLLCHPCHMKEAKNELKLYK